jgi:hypothetical protein
VIGMLLKISTAIALLIALVLNDCGQNEQPRDLSPPPKPPGVSEICVQGELTSEGVECPAFRSSKGEVYSLVGDVQGVDVGDPVCVCGAPVEVSTCQQGQTLAINYLDVTCPSGS